MGQVFTWESVRKGRVPMLEDFGAVIAELKERAASEPSILGMIVCGSVMRGDHNVRSDVDCYTLYDPKLQREAFKFMQEMTEHAAAVFVPLGFVPCDLRIAGTSMHHVGGSFRRHLEKSVHAQGLIKGDPLSPLVQTISERAELENYQRTKMYNLQEAYAQVSVFSEERLVAYLKKTLEAPLHVARKTLAHMEPLSGDSKAYVRSRYREVMPVSVADHLDRLVGLDSLYTSELLAHIWRPGERAYRGLLRHLAQQSESVLDFVRDNAIFIATAAR